MQMVVLPTTVFSKLGKDQGQRTWRILEKLYSLLAYLTPRLNLFKTLVRIFIRWTYRTIRKRGLVGKRDRLTTISGLVVRMAGRVTRVMVTWNKNRLPTRRKC